MIPSQLHNTISCTTGNLHYHPLPINFTKFLAIQQVLKTESLEIYKIIVMISISYINLKKKKKYFVIAHLKIQKSEEKTSKSVFCHCTPNESGHLETNRCLGKYFVSFRCYLVFWEYVNHKGLLPRGPLDPLYPTSYGQASILLVERCQTLIHVLHLSTAQRIRFRSGTKKKHP